MSKYSDTEETIGGLVRRLESDYTTGGSVIVSKYVEDDMFERLNKIEAYINSRHTSGETDSLEREKPFFNICTAAVNIWYRATDIDRKNIHIQAAKSADTVESFLATVHVQDWMRRYNFGIFLNDWGRSLARYGSSVVKFVEKDDELHCNVVPWNRLIVDSVDFDNNPKIEKLELTEGQLRTRSGYDKKMVEALCDARSTRTTLEGTDKDNKSDYITLYELHGLLPLSYLTGKKSDEDEYVQQMHVISFLANKDTGEYDDFTLVKGREAKDPYMITHLIAEDGMTLSIGAVQHLFEAQWMVNHSIKAVKDQLDLASKIVYQTSDPSFVGQNALSSIENGDILVWDPKFGPLTQVANNSHDTSALQSFGAQWKALGNEIVGISESMLGNTAPSGTAWRQVETLLQQNQSLFKLMRQNKGLDIEEMFRRYILPFIKKQMDTSDEVTAILEQHEINKIDAKYIKNKSVSYANEAIKKSFLAGVPVNTNEQSLVTQSIAGDMQSTLNEQGNQRFFKPSEIEDSTWKEMFKDLEWDVIVDVTGEEISDDAVTTLTTLISTIARNPAILQDPNMKMAFNKILTLTNAVSPLEISNASIPSPIQPTSPQATPTGASVGA